ncbi:MAG: formyltetrahydrofolate deformylase [Planctomycetia bacterium]|nr:formyltetrahydrofolate deformylase [Planctomycetia bacterium]
MAEPTDEPSLREVVLVDCPDEVGLIHRITGVLAAHQFNIESNQEFVDVAAGHFFFRAEVTAAGTAAEAVERLQADLAAVLPAGATVRVASRERQPIGVPFTHLPHDGVSRDTHEQQLAAAIDQYAPAVIVLARYMRILSAGFVDRYAGRLVNIHHSFLPAFVGASPYRQAFERGVKVIGATAHFVTAELDAGPIIAQDVIPVDHRFSADRMAQAGRDVEKLVLARAVRLVLEDRVFVHGDRTVVFG